MPRGSVHAHAPVRLVVARQGLEELDPRLAEGLRISHDVGLADSDEVGRVEHAADPDLQFQALRRGSPYSPASMACSSSFRCIPTHPTGTFHAGRIVGRALRQGLEELDPRLAEGLRISHDVGLADSDEGVRAREQKRYNDARHTRPTSGSAVPPVPCAAAHRSSPASMACYTRAVLLRSGSPLTGATLSPAQWGRRCCWAPAAVCWSFPTRGAARGPAQVGLAHVIRHHMRRARPGLWETSDYVDCAGTDRRIPR